MTVRKTVLYTQVRTGSTRLPGKVLQQVGEYKYLDLFVRRLKQISTVDEIVILTTNLSTDDIIEDYARDLGVACFRGSELDLLDRHYQANKVFQGDIIVKIPSDCPFVDKDIADRVISLVKARSEIDYASNYHPATYPDGLDVEAFRSDALEVAWKHAREGFQREHTTPFIWDQPDSFSIANIINKRGNMFMSHRWTVDYKEDLEFVRAVYKVMGYSYFGFEEMIDMLACHPDIGQINERLCGVNWYRNVKPGSLKTIGKGEFKEL